MAKGGKRPGAGRPKGVKETKPRSILSKEQAREVVRQMISEHIGPMIEAQISNAKGINYLIIRDKKTGKFIRVGKGMAEKINAESEELIEVWEKDPSVQAFTDLMNRAIDKPKEQEQEVKLTGALELVSRLHAARQHIATRSRS